MLSDKELVQQFIQTRSDRAFRQLYRSATPDLYRLALHLARKDQYIAEEAVQEMWVVAIRKIELFEWRSSLKTWLTGILINIIRKKVAGVPQHKLPDGREKATAVQPVVFDRYDLEQAIASLPDGYRHVLVLYDVEGYRHREIAGLLDISEGTSKSQLFYARRAVRQFINEQKNGGSHA